MPGGVGVCCIEVDVSAYAPRMQRTLVELGFLPVAYLPALVFHEVERLDVVKMVRLLDPPEVSHRRAHPELPGDGGRWSCAGSAAGTCSPGSPRPSRSSRSSPGSTRSKSTAWPECAA